MNKRLFVGATLVLGAIVSIVAVSWPSGSASQATAQQLTLEDRFPDLVSQLGEPVTQDFVSQFEGTNLDFVLETARVTTNEFGATVITWDEPAGVRPSVAEALKMTAEANEKDDSSLLPLCSQAYWDYLIENKPPEGQKTCKSVPEQMVLGAPGSPALSVTDPDHVGYYYDAGTAEGIYGNITITDPVVPSNGFLAARHLAQRTNYLGNDWWIEAGWVEYPSLFGNDQITYSQVCNSASSSCFWYDGAESDCDDANNAIVFLGSENDPAQTWRSWCWNFGTSTWVEMRSTSWSDDDASVVESMTEVAENEPGTINIGGTITHYALDLRLGNTSWFDWDTSFSVATHSREEGGYNLTTNTSYYDFSVDD